MGSSIDFILLSFFSSISWYFHFAFQQWKEIAILWVFAAFTSVHSEKNRRKIKRKNERRFEIDRMCIWTEKAKSFQLTGTTIYILNPMTRKRWTSFSLELSKFVWNSRTFENKQPKTKWNKTIKTNRNAKKDDSRIGLCIALELQRAERRTFPSNQNSRLIQT